MKGRVVPVRYVIKRSTILGMSLAPSPHNASKESFPYYHIKGMCNSICRREGYHHPYLPVGECALVSWSNKVILGEEGGGRRDESVMSKDAAP